MQKILHEYLLLLFNFNISFLFEERPASVGEANDLFLPLLKLNYDICENNICVVHRSRLTCRIPSSRQTEKCGGGGNESDAKKIRETLA